jgi:hypothetical protein
MATATHERRYSLNMNESEAQTLIAVLANIYVPPFVADAHQQDTDNIVHLHEVLAKQGLDTEYVFPLVAGD